MRNLGDTIARMAALRDRQGHTPMVAGDRLTDLPSEASNPGALRGRTYIPASLPDHAPLVVVLHGCTQNAAAYDHASGWSTLADRHGFALLYPEQQRSNNPNLCFNWFDPQDDRRGQGEVLSIHQMIATMVQHQALDPERIFITGLSAGGAMTAAMLAAYPELFAGGAIIAGLPFGTAASVPQAFDRMRGHGLPDEAALTALVRGASRHAGRWPTISIWHGTDDATVHPANADAILGQWRALHGVAATPSREERVDGYPRRVWCDAAGREVIEDYRIGGMGHGTPLATSGAQACGTPAPFMLEVGISSTQRIAAFWKLTDTVYETVPSLDPERVVPVRPAGVGGIIEDALRTAGLMR